MIFYLIIFILILLICLRAYIRVKHVFWAIQPVIHSYDLFKVFYKSGIINKDLPEINKYCNFLNIQTYKYDELNSSNIKLIKNFVYENYLNNEYSHYKLTNKYFNACFNGHNGSSYLSIYADCSLLQEENNKITLENFIQILKNCILTENIDVENMPSFDVIYLFIKIREKSMGEIINISVRDSQAKKQFDAEMNLNNIKIIKNI